MKRVLITGATGFIGRQCLSSLLAKGDREVHVISQRAPEKEFASARWHQADLLDSEQMSGVVKEVSPSHLLHLAWYAEPGAYWTSLQNFRWVQASLDLFTEFAAHGGQRIVAAGTCAEYDWTGAGICSEVSTPLAPATLYGTCKHALRIMLEAFAQQTNLSVAWGRIFFLFGPHEHPNRLVPSVIRSLLKGEAARCSHGRQVRDFLYVADVAEAFVKLLDSEVQGAVNIGSGRPASLQELINEIGSQLQRPELIQLNAVPAQPNEPEVLVAAVDRLTREVEWQPRFGLSEGIEQTIEWWRQNMDAAAVA